MPQAAEIYQIVNFYPHHSFLKKLQAIVEPSAHSHEQACYHFLLDLEDLRARNLLSESELALIGGKAIDILLYFRFTLEGLAAENSWYRASVIHQLCCGMLQVLRLVRPDLHASGLFGETSYHLYRYRLPGVEVMSGVRPLQGKQW